MDSQLKVFFGELKEIKAVIKLSAISHQHSAGKKKELKAESGKLKAVSRKGRRLKFSPEITRVKLNPEQAVLTCDCYNYSLRRYSGSIWGDKIGFNFYCYTGMPNGEKAHGWFNYFQMGDRCITNPGYRVWRVGGEGTSSSS
ncbi:MAG: hypothetical protein KJ711_00165 [Candidatus Omnitrophica bacterium]|nr:hypothetical protein [Candidatus Omnitrophota bacterium]MBU1523225.1 hypothetical protein [Candidatus Omnitrophota bacterium]